MEKINASSHNIRTNRFRWKNIDNIWVSQQDGWTCQLAAFRIILRYFHIDISEQNLIETLKEEKFKVFDFGTFLPFIGVIALRLGLNITYRTKIENEYPENSPIISSVNLIRKIIHNDIQNIIDTNPVKLGYNAFLKIMDLGGKIYFHQPYSPPSFKEIMEALKKGPVMVLVSGKEYYKINEDWDHTLILIPNNSYNFIVFDVFKEKGYECYQRWGKHLSYAKKYNWKKWKGRMIEFEKKI